MDLDEQKRIWAVMHQYIGSCISQEQTKKLVDAIKVELERGREKENEK